MFFQDKYTCDRCKREIIGSAVTVSFKNLTGQSPFSDGLDLCSDCFLGFIDWVKNPEPTKMGPVERIARRMNE
jgi:hypothetical protein